MVDEGADSGDLRSWTPQHNRIHRFVSRWGIPPTCIKLIFASRNIMTYTMWSWVTMVSHWVPSFWTRPDQESLLFEACQTLVETHEKEELVMFVKQWLPPYFDGPFMVKSGMVVLLLLYEHHMCVETYLPLRSGYDFTLCHFSAGPFEMSVDVNNYLSLNKPGRISRIQYFIANDCITQYHKQFGSIG